MVNPSSITSVQTVIKHINELATKKNTGRKWTIIVSDGVPYVYGAKLQDEMVRCSVCNEVFENKD